ncbi:hypothetical protein PENSPDRAFT_653681 [Peniophora sp. CONT]|nr:hypothetical protein PENSPDRAFT_653681 [Peniophora sp. CONT]
MHVTITNITASSNASRSIDQLPNELLAEIFGHTYDMLTIERDGRVNGLPTCVFLSHVCQRWRNVAIACQYLWAVLPCRSREWTMTCLARVPSVPVALRFNISWGTSDARLSEPRHLTFHMIPRARSLRAWFDLDFYERARSDTREVLDNLETHAAPLLKELEIGLIQHSDSSWEDSYVPTDVPDLFKGKTPPKLRHILLDGCAIHRTSSIFSSVLTNIQIENSYIWRNMDEMIEFFRSVPLLESFIFSYPRNPTKHNFSTESSQRHPLRCVPLPKLQHFAVDASFEATIRMFSYLAFSPNAMLRLMLSDNEPMNESEYNEADLEDLITRGAASVREHYAQCIRDERYHESVEIDYNRVTGPSFCLMIPSALCDGIPRLRAAAAAMYLSIPVFSNATTLIIRGPTDGFITRDLLCCEKVERMCLQGVAPAYLEALLLEGLLPSNELFPDCTEITIRDFNFAKGVRLIDAYLHLPDGLDLRLAKVLKARRKDTPNLLELILEQCILGPHTVDIFEAALGVCQVRVVGAA